MKSRMSIGLMLIIALCSPAAAWSQHEEVEEAAQAIEEIAEALNEKTGDIAEAIERTMEENSAELEAWAEQYSEQWERWAERSEKRFNRWAEEQEEMWDEWAERYSGRWERWAEQLESNHLEGEELGKLIQGNLEMLGDMPLGEMVEGLLKEGAGGLESAPWESLHDLQGMFQDAIKNSVDEVERRMENSEVELARMFEAQAAAEARAAAAVQKAEQESELGYILPVIEKQQDGLKAKRRILDNEAKNALKKIESVIQNEDVDADELKALLKEIIGASKDRAMSAANAEKERAAEKARKLKRRKLEQAREAAAKRVDEERERALGMRNRAMQERDSARAAYQEALEQARTLRRDKAKASLKKTIENLEEGERPIAEVYRALRQEEEKLMKKSDELELLKQEIINLRKEVEKMKSDK